MGKMTGYILIMTGVTVLFYFTGLLSNTPNTVLLNLVLNTGQLTATPLYTKLSIAVLVLGVGGTILLGFISKQPELAATGLFTAYLVSLLFDFVSVFNVLASTNKALAILILSPWLILFIVTAIEWWRGRD